MAKVKQEMNTIKDDFFRFDFDDPLNGNLSIEEIKGTKVKSNSTQVHIKDISANGLRFESDLNFPLRNDVVYHFKTEVLGKEIAIQGKLKEQETEGEKFGYNVEFHFKDEKTTLQQELVQLVNALQVSTRHGRKRAYKLLEGFAS